MTPLNVLKTHQDQPNNCIIDRTEEEIQKVQNQIDNIKDRIDTDYSKTERL